MDKIMYIFVKLSLHCTDALIERNLSNIEKAVLRTFVHKVTVKQWYITGMVSAKIGLLLFREKEAIWKFKITIDKMWVK